ncbi:MAG TPA: hypothetical protein VKZ50_19985 [bacterium]|nr:hypothetical protein [bacterium]
MRTIAAGALVLVCAVVLGMPLTGSAQNMMMGTAAQIQTELKTATFHAGELAQKANALAAVQLHTHHVLNCLEGPNGPDFFAQAGNPCQGQGNGIIPDLQAAVMHMMPGAQSALQEAMISQSLAKQALASKDINEAQPFVLVVSRHLQAASQDLGQ